MPHYWGDYGWPRVGFASVSGKRFLNSNSLLGLITVLTWFLFGQQPAGVLGYDQPVDNTTQRIQFGGRTFGPIQYSVTIAQAPDGLDTEVTRNEVADTLERINRLMSNYQPDSDVSRFNDFNSTEWFDVDAETEKVVAKSIEISRLSNGAFDITLAPAIDRWRFGVNDSEDTFQLPTNDELNQLKSVVGYQMLETRSQPPAIRKSNPKVQINLSGAAKGYAVDAVAETLRSLGIDNFLVEVGGEVYAAGLRNETEKWRTGVMIPDSYAQSAYDEIVPLSNQAIATSGDYQNFFVVRGQRFSHTIDPKTCSPIENLVASVSVVADDCMTADAVATAVMVLGSDKGMELAKEMGLELLIKSRNKDFGDEITTRQTPNFPLLQKTNPLEANQAEAPRNRQANHSIWPVFVAASIVILLAVASMAIGSIVSNRPITGSCGGLANRTNQDGEEVCGVCSKPTQDCPEKV